MRSQTLASRPRLGLGASRNERGPKRERHASPAQLVSRRRGWRISAS